MKLTDKQIKTIERASSSLAILALDLGKVAGSLLAIQHEIPSIVLPDYLDLRGVIPIVNRTHIISDLLREALDMNFASSAFPELPKEKENHEG